MRTAPGFSAARVGQASGRRRRIKGRAKEKKEAGRKELELERHQRIFAIERRQETFLKERREREREKESKERAEERKSSRASDERAFPRPGHLVLLERSSQGACPASRGRRRPSPPHHNRELEQRQFPQEPQGSPAGVRVRLDSRQTDQLEDRTRRTGPR